MAPLRASYATGTAANVAPGHGWPPHSHISSPKAEYLSTKDGGYHHLDARSVRPRLSAPTRPARPVPPPASPSPDAEARPSPSQSSSHRGGAQGAKTMPSKACVNCRRSKVKCVNDGGGGPCRRCSDVNLECKWRVRVDDETWRESVESRFSQLSSILGLLSAPAAAHKAQAAALAAPIAAPLAAPIAVPLAPAAAEVYQHPAYGSLHPPPKSGSMLPPPSAHPAKPAAPAATPSYTSFPPPLAKTSPQSDFGSTASTLFSAPSPRDRLPPPVMMLSTDTSMPNGDCSPWSLAARGRSASTARVEGLLAAHSQPVFPNTDDKTSSPLGDLLRSSQTTRDSPESLQSRKSPLLSYQGHVPAILQAANSCLGPVKMHEPSVRWLAGSYSSAVSYVGQEDPRLSLISLRLLPCPMATSLFVYFGKNMQSHSFGFPTFPPNEKITPIILASICLVASLFDPTARQYTPSIRHYIANEAKQSEADSLTEYQRLNPELGIGVEEITGLCIAASWLSGQDGNRLAKVARYWALAYLRQFEAQMCQGGSPGEREKTISEKLTLLPPYRIIDRALRLRIWLESYIVDAAASIMHNRDLFSPDKSPKPVYEELWDSLPALGGDTYGRGCLSSEDAQLIAHAGILDILVAATKAASKGASPEHAMTRLQQLMDTELEIWRERIGRDVDLSLNTPVALDLGLTYYLARSLIGSLSLSLSASSGLSSLSSPSSRAQYTLITQAKEAALLALQIVRGSLSERLIRLPTWYHFLLSHSVGFLLRLLQEQKWILASQSHYVLSQAESFVQLAHHQLSIHTAQSPSYPTVEAHGATSVGSSFSSSSSSSSLAALDGVAGGKGEEISNAAAAVAARQNTAAAGATGGEHPAAAMIQEMYHGVVRMRSQMTSGSQSVSQSIVM